MFIVVWCKMMERKEVEMFKRREVTWLCNYWIKIPSDCLNWMKIQIYDMENHKNICHEIDIILPEQQVH